MLMLSLLYQISSKNKLKANHNELLINFLSDLLYQISSKNKLKANHNSCGSDNTVSKLYQISSKNKLKANHNMDIQASSCQLIVSNIVKEQIESKSQLKAIHYRKLRYCIKYRQRTNWKQITTKRIQVRSAALLYQISSKNKLKANHNIYAGRIPHLRIVSNIVKEQIESKSQQ